MAVEHIGTGIGIGTLILTSLIPHGINRVVVGHDSSRGSLRL